MVVIRRLGTVVESPGKKVVHDRYPAVAVLKFGGRGFTLWERHWQIWMGSQL